MYKDNYCIVVGCFFMISVESHCTVLLDIDRFFTAVVIASTHRMLKFMPSFDLSSSPGSWLDGWSLNGASPTFGYQSKRMFSAWRKCVCSRRAGSRRGRACCFSLPCPRLFITNTRAGNHWSDPLLTGLIVVDVGIEYSVSSLSGLVLL